MITPMDHIQILLKEYDTLRSEIVSRSAHWYQLAAVAAIVAGWLVSRPIDRTLLISLAFLAVAAVIFAGSLARDIYICAARVRQLEAEINGLAKAELLKWETHYGVGANYFWRRIPK